MAKLHARNLNGEDYRKGALERLSDARILLDTGQLAGSASNAGRAVEGMLRAVIWKRDPDVRTGQKSLVAGHDLRELLTHVRNLGLLSSFERQEDGLEELVQQIGRLWFNNMRFVSSRFLETRWYNLGEVRKG
jgi:HEPN domain-containing protein